MKSKVVDLRRGISKPWPPIIIVDMGDYGVGAFILRDGRLGFRRICSFLQDKAEVDVDPNKMKVSWDGIRGKGVATATTVEEIQATLEKM